MLRFCASPGPKISLFRHQKHFEMASSLVGPRLRRGLVEKAWQIIPLEKRKLE